METELPKNYSGRDVGKYVLPLINRANKEIKIISPYLSAKYVELLIAKAKQGVDVKIITSDSDGEKHKFALDLIKKKNGLKGWLSYKSGIGILIFLAILFFIKMFDFIIANLVWAVVFTLITVFSIVLTKILLDDFGEPNKPYRKSENDLDRLKRLTNMKVEDLAQEENDIRNYKELEAEYFVDQVKSKKKVKSENLPSKFNVKVTLREDLIHTKIFIIDNVGIVGSANLTTSGMYGNFERIEIKRSNKSVSELKNTFNKLWY